MSESEQVNAKLDEASGGQDYTFVPTTGREPGGIKELILGVVCGVLITAIIGIAALRIVEYKQTPQHLQWMSEIAKQVDPAFAGKQTGFIVLSMSCYDPYERVRGTEPITYEYAKFDVNMKTGVLKPLGDVMYPPQGFKCPEMKLPEAQSTPPPQPPTAPAPAAPVVPAKKK